jgi:hypothetical protein
MTQAKVIRKHHEVMLDSLMVFCSDKQITSLTNNPDDAKRQINWHRRQHCTMPGGDKPVLTLWTGAKAYSRGNGWWAIVGYAQDMSDINDVEAFMLGAGANQ